MNISLHSIPTLLGALSALFIGLFVFLKKPKNQTHIAYFAFCLSLFGWLFGYTLVYSSKSAAAAIWGARIACSLSGFTSPTFYHLAVSYLNKKDEYKYVILSYLLMCVAFVLFITTPFFLSGTYRYSWGFYSKAGLLHPLFLAVFFAFAFRGFFLLYKSYKKRKELSQNEATQTAYVFIAYFIAMFGTIDYIVKYGVGFYPFGWIFEVVFAIIIAYAITKHQLMDIRVVIGKTLAHILTIAILGSIYLGLAITCLNLTGNEPGWIFFLLTICYGILVGEIFQKVRHIIQTPVDKFFIRESYDFSSVSREIATKFRQSLTHRDIIKNIHDILSQTVDIQKMEFFFLNPSSKNLAEWSVETGEEVPNSSINNHDPLISEILAKRDIVKIPIDSSHSGELCIPSFEGNKILSLLIIGKKRSEDTFTEQDFNLFRTIAEYLTIALEYIIRPYEEVELRFEQSERKLLKAEKKLFRSQRLASIGTLTAGVTHEIRNPLGIIRSGIELLPKQDRDKQYLLKFRDKYLKHADRIEKIVQHVLNLARDEQNKPVGDININKLAEDTLSLVQLKEGVTIVTEFESVPPIKGIKEDLERVFINLLENADHALPEGGIITLKTYVKKDEDNLIEKVIAEVSDTGIGIPKDNIEKIFDPFFSGRHGGTGLGLSISDRIIKEHGGDLSVKSTEGKGTTFYLSFNIAAN